MKTKAQVTVTVAIIVDPHLSLWNALKMRLAGGEAAVEMVRQMSCGVADTVSQKLKLGKVEP